MVDYTFTNWKVRRGPEGLSVNNKNSVIVVCADDGRVEVYSADGIKLHEIMLQIGRIWHAIQLPNESGFIISRSETCGTSIASL